MARNQTKTRKTKATPPALIAYHVAERGKKGFWTRIGAAWDHQDGKGYTIQLDLVPVDGGRIVLRPMKDDDDAADGEDTGDAAEEADDEEEAGEEE